MRSDMYSFALVMWEVLRRTEADDADDLNEDEALLRDQSTHALPYHNLVGQGEG